MQLQAEVKSLPSDDRRALLADLEFKIEIPALTSLALKADLCLPWNKMRNMKRYVLSPLKKGGGAKQKNCLHVTTV